MPSNTFQESLDSNPYFMSLPAYVQETIKQTGIEITSEEELRRGADGKSGSSALFLDPNFSLMRLMM